MSENIAVTHPAGEGWLTAPPAICRRGGARLDCHHYRVPDVPKHGGSGPRHPLTRWETEHKGVTK
jgi:hypothetical protein